MEQLQTPKFLYMNKALRLWDEGKLHVGCEAVNRGLNVFEGLKGYWQPDGTFAVVNVSDHYRRLQRSSRILHIPFTTAFDEFSEAINQLAAALLVVERDMWFRTTLFVTEGHWGEGTVADLVVTAYNQEKVIPSPVDLGISTWQRSTDLSLPCRAKTGTNYQVARLARIEGRQRGCSDMILLNGFGRVAESTASCVLIVRDGAIYTPTASEGALESITVDILEALAASLDIPFFRRPIDRTELMVADEIALVGTLAEVMLARSIDGLPLDGDAPILSRLQARYFQAVRGLDPHSSVHLCPVGLI